jgi:hypothetical protein
VEGEDDGLALALGHLAHTDDQLDQVVDIHRRAVSTTKSLALRASMQGKGPMAFEQRRLSWKDSRPKVPPRGPRGPAPTRRPPSGTSESAKKSKAAEVLLEALKAEREKAAFEAARTTTTTRSPANAPTGPRQTAYTIFKTGNECRSSDTYIGPANDMAVCSYLCAATRGCKYFVYGFNTKKCWWEKTTSSSCPQGWKPSAYNFGMVGPGCCSAYRNDCLTCYASSTCGGACYWFPGRINVIFGGGRCAPLSSSAGGSCPSTAAGYYRRRRRAPPYNRRRRRAPFGDTRRRTFYNRRRRRAPFGDTRRRRRAPYQYTVSGASGTSYSSVSRPDADPAKVAKPLGLKTTTWFAVGGGSVLAAAAGLFACKRSKRSPRSATTTPRPRVPSDKTSVANPVNSDKRSGSVSDTSNNQVV